MISVERSFEAWEEVQRHGVDLADRLAQGFTDLIQSHITPPSFSWPNSAPNLFEVEFPTYNFINKDFGLSVDNTAISSVTAIIDIGNRIGQVGADFGECINGVAQQFFRRVPVPFLHDESVGFPMAVETHSTRSNMGISLAEDFKSLPEHFKDFRVSEEGGSAALDDSPQEETFGLSAKALKLFGRSQGTLNMTSTYNSRTGSTESSLVARGDAWRVEASQGSSTSRNEKPPLFLLQLGPLLFFHDSTLLLPVNLSNQHFLWYGYDRKNGLHSLCPAIWSKHRRWLLMSTFRLNPFACSFMDLQFPNGQITYASGEGFSTSAFIQLWGGLLQVQGQYPGEMNFSFSMKANKWGTRVTPTLHWPDRSFALKLEQALAWRRSGLMMRPSLQFSVCPTFGGTCPGLQMELIHSLKEQLSLICGCALVAHPRAFASVSLGRSKWNGNVGNAGVVVKVETPMGDYAGSGSSNRPSFSVQLNSGFEF